MTSKQVPPVLFLIDNQPTIELIKNNVLHQRTKHINTRYFFAREKQASSEINVRYVPMEEQLADPLTKALASPRFKSLRQLWNIKDLPGV